MSDSSSINISGDSRVNGPVIVTNSGTINQTNNTTNNTYGDIRPLAIDAETLNAAEQHLAVMPVDNVPDPEPLPPGSRMSFAVNPLFVGRVDDLKELATRLKGNCTVGVGQIVVASGLGGIGKTQLATEFVQRYGQFFASVHWLSFTNAEGVPAEVAACGGAGGLMLRPDFVTLPLNEQVGLVLAAWHSPLPRLLIFDNCEDEELLQAWRPKTGSCRVLVTSRRAAWDAVLGLHSQWVDVLPRAKSVELLRKHRPDLPTNDPILTLIAEELGDLPLALHLAGSFLSLYQADLTPGEYLAELKEAEGLTHDSFEGEGISPTGHTQSVARTFKLSYDRLKHDDAMDALAIQLLARAAQFAPGEPIPCDLLLTTVELPTEDRRAVRRGRRTLRRLTELGLVELVGDDMLRLHRLLAGQAVFPQRNLVGNDHAVRHSARVGVSCQGKQGVHFSAKVRFQFEQALVADRFALGGIGVQLGAIDTDVPEFEHTHGLSQQEDLYKEVLQVREKGGAEGGDGIVVGVQVASNEAERSRLVGCPFEFAGGEDASGSWRSKDRPDADHARMRQTSGVHPPRYLRRPRGHPPDRAKAGARRLRSS